MFDKDYKVIYPNGRWCVDSGPAPGAGRDDGPPRHAPGPGDPLQDQEAGWRLLPAGPDPLNDQEWDRMCSARGDEGEPGDEDAEWYADPDHGPPPELTGLPVAVILAQVEADGAE